MTSTEERMGARVYVRVYTRLVSCSYLILRKFQIQQISPLLSLSLSLSFSLSLSLSLSIYIYIYIAEKQENQ